MTQPPDTRQLTLCEEKPFIPRSHSVRKDRSLFRVTRHATHLCMHAYMSMSMSMCMHASPWRTHARITRRQRERRRTGSDGWARLSTGRGSRPRGHAHARVRTRRADGHVHVHVHAARMHASHSDSRERRNARETDGAQGETRRRDATAASTCSDALAVKTREAGKEAKIHSHNDNERINQRRARRQHATRPPHQRSRGRAKSVRGHARATHAPRACATARVTTRSHIIQQEYKMRVRHAQRRTFKRRRTSREQAARCGEGARAWTGRAPVLKARHSGDEQEEAIVRTHARPGSHTHAISLARRAHACRPGRERKSTTHANPVQGGGRSDEEPNPTGSSIATAGAFYSGKRLGHLTSRPHPRKKIPRKRWKVPRPPSEKKVPRKR